MTNPSDDEVFDYYLWHLRQTTRARYTVDITAGDKWNAPTLSPEFLNKLQERLQVETPLTNCMLSPSRTTYYSDSAAENWEDVWRLFWILDLDVSDPVQKPPDWQDEYLGLVAFDPATMVEQPGSKTTDCVLYVDFASQRDAESFRDRLGKDAGLTSILTSVSERTAQVNLYPLFDFLTRVKIVLYGVPSSLLETNSHFADRVFQTAQDMHGFTNFDERTLELDEYFSETGIS